MLHRIIVRCSGRLRPPSSRVNFELGSYDCRKCNYNDCDLINRLSRRHDVREDRVEQQHSGFGDAKSRGFHLDEALPFQTLYCFP